MHFRIFGYYGLEGSIPVSKASLLLVLRSRVNRVIHRCESVIECGGGVVVFALAIGFFGDDNFFVKKRNEHLNADRTVFVAFSVWFIDVYCKPPNARVTRLYAPRFFVDNWNQKIGVTNMAKTQF